MYDSVCTLFKEASRTYDTYLNETVTYTTRQVYCQARSIYNSEFYNAAITGLHPSITLTLSHRDDYEGETVVSFEGKMYDVIRTDWTAQRDKLSLILQERTNVD